MSKSSRTQKKSDEKSNPNYFSWTDDEVELLLNVFMDYKEEEGTGYICLSVPTDYRRGYT